MASRTIGDLYRQLVSTWTSPNSIMQGVNGWPAILLDDPIPASALSSPAAQMMYLDALTYLPDDILCKVDRAAMGIGLETRVPLLSRDVIAISAQLPQSMKIRDGIGKWALRQILYKHVPRELIERPKVGFSAPIGLWLRGSLREWAEELLSETQLRSQGFLDPAPIRRIWQDHIEGSKDFSKLLWPVLIFQAWQEKGRLG